MIILISDTIWAFRLNILVNHQLVATVFMDFIFWVFTFTGMNRMVRDTTLSCSHIRILSLQEHQRSIFIILHWLLYAWHNVLTALSSTEQVAKTATLPCPIVKNAPPIQDA